MNDQQYGLLVIQLSALDQAPNALDTLDDEQLANLAFLLDQAKERVAAKRQEGKTGSVYSLVDCPFQYCDNPPACESIGRCRYVAPKV